MDAFLRCSSDSRRRMRASASPSAANTSKAAAETTTAHQPQPGARSRVTHTLSRLQLGSEELNTGRQRCDRTPHFYLHSHKLILF